MKINFNKGIAFLLFLALLVPPRLGWAEEWQNVSQIPSQEIAAVSEETASQNVLKDKDESLDSTTFLQDVSPLSEVPRDDEFERYDFQNAVDLFRPEYASAVIVKELKAENLAELVRLPFEVAIVVLEGEIVLFSSGSEDEIGVLPAVKELTRKAGLMTHTHPTIYSAEGPSGEDINEAASHPGPEYAVTKNGVYAYTGDGILNDGNPYSCEEYIRTLNAAVEASRGTGDASQARKDLNLFIVAQDQYNRASELEREIFRMGGTLTYSSGLNSTSVTVLPGNPFPYYMAGSSSATALSLNPDGRFKLDYNVTASGSFSGMTVSFDNASTSQVETQNVSGFTYLTFGLQGTANAAKVEIMDLNGNKDTFTLTNISSSTERFWRIKTSAIISSVDKTRIKQINIFVNQSTTSSTKRTGTVYINTKGLNTNPPTQPVVTSSVPNLTHQTTLTLSGTKEANTSVMINGVEVVARNTSTTWSKTVNLSTEGTNSFNIQTKNSIGKLSTVTSISTVRDTTPPVIVPENLPAGNQIDLPYLVIPYLVQDANAQNPEEFAAFDLVAGSNDLVLTATDGAGNQTQLHVTLQYIPPDANLTAQEKTLRQNWIVSNFPYFTESQGIDAASGFPIDIIGPNALPGIFWTQPTSIGFYLDLLGNIISKRIVLASFSQAAALAAAEKTLTSLLNAQSQFGWQGLIPWLRLEEGVSPDSPQIGLIDNANLTHHLAVLLGLLEKGNLQRTLAASIYQKAKTFIDAEGQGYLAFVDPVFGVFRGVYRTDWGTFDGYADRFGSEVRATLPFLIEYYGVPSSVLTNLIRSVSAYPTLQGRTIEMFSAFDGGAFQYFWPLLLAPEESLPQISGSLQNALLAFSDLMLRKGLAGFLSASSLPEGGYSAKLGINFLKETPDLLDETVASVYALASAYRLNPSWVIERIRSVEQSFPALSGPLGFYDAMRLGGSVSQNYYAIDQGALLLGLLGTGADDFRSFMEKRNKWSAYTSHYSSLPFDIPQAVASFPEPALTQTEMDARVPDSPDFYRSGLYAYNGVSGNGIDVSETSPGVFTYHKTQPSGWIGGMVTPETEQNPYDYAVIQIRSLTEGANQVQIELKHYNQFVLQKTLSLEGTGWQTFQLFFSRDTSINFIAFSGASNDFEVRQLYFTDTPIFQMQDDLYTSGVYDFNGITGNGITVSGTSPGVHTYTRTAPTGWIGGFVTPAVDRSAANYVVIQIRSLSEGANQVRLELKNDSNFILQQNLTLQGTGWQTYQFALPANAPPVNFIAFADATSDFEVRTLYFTNTPLGPPAAVPDTPEIIQTSPSTTTNSHYLLTYTVNGFPRSEWTDLVPGQNTLRRTFVDALGQSIAFDFHVNLL